MTDYDHHDSSPPPGDSISLLTPGEVAAMYKVHGKTVNRWADRGMFTTFRTPGGHRRYLADEVFAAIAETSTAQARS